MDIQELYDWALKVGVAFSDLIVKDDHGHETKEIKPTIVVQHNKYGEEYYEVKL